MSNIFPIDFEEKLTMAQNDYILFSDSEDGNKIKKAQYKNLKGEKGDPGTNGTNGQDGAAATITVGSTTTGAAGSSASVTNSGTSSAAVLDFTIPQGAKGEPGQDGADGNDGAAATITVGTTTTLPAGSSATVTNVGTSQDAILNFGIPKGDAGTGDVNGPASSTDGHLAVFDGNTGKIIKDGGAIPTGVPAVGSNGQVLTVVSGAAAWANATGGSDIVYATQAEYNALLPGAASDGKHYFIYTASGRLPSAYQEVEYIESSGTQYIDTGFKASSNVSMELVIRPNISYVSEYAMLGDAWSADAMFLMEYDGKYRFHNGGSYTDAGNITNEKTTIEIDNTGITVNGINTSLSAGSSYSNYNIRLFSTGDNAYSGGKRGRFKVYSFKIENNGTLVRDFVPCYRIADGVIGMYDLANDVFYTNAGTGTFTKGSDI